jgi:hypothetical protein
MRLATITSILVLGLAASAQGAEPYDTWLAESRVPIPDQAMTVVNEPCPAPPAVVCAWNGTIYNGSTGTTLARSMFFHEVGHVYSYGHISDEAGAAFLSAVGKDGTDWNATQSQEVFADTYSLCARQRIRNRKRYSLDVGPTLSAERARAACRVIRAS